MITDRDPLELRVLGMMPGRTFETPDGRTIATADARWGELSSTWHLPAGAGDPFENGWDGGPSRPHAHQSSGRFGLAAGLGMLVFAVRARVDSLEAASILAGEPGGRWTIALHYLKTVKREQRLNFLVREEMLLGTPLRINDRLPFGLFVVPEDGAQNTACSVTFSLVGLLLGGARIVDEQASRYSALYAATHPVPP